MSSLSDLLRCPVCAQIFDQPCDFECGHTVCASCIDQMLEHKSQETDPPTPRQLIVLLACPTCRQLHEITGDRFPVNYVIREIAEYYRREAAMRICDCSDGIPVNAPEAVQELQRRIDSYKSLAEGRQLTIQQLTAVTVRDHQTKQRLEAEMSHLHLEMDELTAQNEKLEDEMADLKFRIQHLMTRCKQKDNLVTFHSTVAEENSILKDSYRLQIRELEAEIKEKDTTIGDLRRQASNLRNQLLQERLGANPTVRINAAPVQPP